MSGKCKKGKGKVVLVLNYLNTTNEGVWRSEGVAPPFLTLPQLNNSLWTQMTY
jgi:hypothetical protein